jgi:hypothetical protein
MSRAARRIRRNRTREMIRQAAATTAAIRGCVCKPRIEHSTIEGVRHLSYYHDDACPAADTGSSLILVRGHNQSSADFARAAVDVVRELPI